MSKPRARQYPIASSPLFRLGSKAKLAVLLGVPLKELLYLADRSENYRLWSTSRRRRDELAGIEHKSRAIQEPAPLLGAIQARLASLLGRIEKPDFVHSATKGRSYLDNALEHASDDPTVKVDIKGFYQHVSRNAVRRFFGDVLQCVPDVAHLLTRLCCVSGGVGSTSCLPTGSAVSPILSYFACAQMFHRIASLAQEYGLTFTLYVDDMVFSGKMASRSFTRRVVVELAREGFVGHKIRHLKAHSMKVITGVAVSGSRVALPFGRQKRIRQIESAFWKVTNDDDIRLLGAALIGQYREAERIQPGSKSRAAVIEARLARLTSPPAKAKKSKKKRARAIPSLNQIADIRAERLGSKVTVFPPIYNEVSAA